MIIYSAIARASDAAILVDCCDPLLKGNAGLIAALLFCHLRDHSEFLQQGGEQQTLVQRNDPEKPDFLSNFLGGCTMALGEDVVDEYYFHLLCKGEIIYLCIGDDSDVLDQKVNFMYLDQLKADFEKQYRPARIRNANAYAFENTFKPNMRMSMHHFNVNHAKMAHESKTRELLARVEDLKKVLGTNIRLLIENGERFEVMLQTSEELNKDAQVFYKNSKAVKRIQRRLYLQKAALHVGVVAVIILVIFLFVSFGECTYCKASSSASSSNNNNNNNNTTNYESGDTNGGNYLRI